MYNDSVILGYFAQYTWLIIILLVWSLIWKGLGLWKSARLSDKAWFIVLLLVNTLGVLEIFYIYVFSKRDNKSKTKIEDKKTL